VGGEVLEVVNGALDLAALLVALFGVRRLITYCPCYVGGAKLQGASMDAPWLMRVARGCPAASCLAEAGAWPAC